MILAIFSILFSVLSRISNRLQELEQMPAQMSVDLRTQALIEFKSLKLLQFQKQLRSEILHTMKVRIPLLFISFDLLFTLS